MIQIRSPRHGAVLNHRHGTQTHDQLTIEVGGTAPVGSAVSVNGVAATRAGDRFTALVALTERETDVTATACDRDGRGSHTVRVVWDRHSRPRYRFAIDDNSFFLRDISKNAYASIFDCFYLGMLRDLHRTYGTKFVLNLFFTTPEEDFDLTAFPDVYRGEWEDNADWLSLAFHAHGEFPSRPYQNAHPTKLAEDFDRLAEQVVRFAGETTLSPPTVIHWAMVHHTALPVLAQRGVKVLSGFFEPDLGGDYTGDNPDRIARPVTAYDINYGLDLERSEYLSRHDALNDFDSGIVFASIDLVCNNTPVERVVPTLAPRAADRDDAEIMDIFTHEQYFWPFYQKHRPDHRERCEAAIRFCTENGYEPVFFHEGFLGAPE